MDENQRLQEVQKALNFSTQERFAKALGIKQGSLSDIYRKKSNVGVSDSIKRVLEKEYSININWLESGKGTMLKKVEEAPVKSSAGIPLIPLDAMAGFGEGEHQIMDYDVKRYVIPEFSALRVDFMIRAKGDSMTPNYRNGDIIGCRKLSLTDIFFQWNKVYVLDTDQGPLLKRIRKGPDKRHIHIVSDNPEYEPFDLSLDKVYAIALVMGSIRFE